jgi:hypothetical protein
MRKRGYSATYTLHAMGQSERRHASAFQISRRKPEQHDVAAIHSLGLCQKLRFQNM